jgi:threonine synthase
VSASHGDVLTSDVRSGESRPTGWRCVVCGAQRAIDEPFVWRCPNSTPDDHRHLLRVVSAPAERDQPRAPSHPNPFVDFDESFAWAAFARAHGMHRDDRRAMVEQLDRAIAQIDGTGFHVTPFGRSAHLSEALGFTPAGGVWVKDETHGVGGSQKARHLASILLHLLAAESLGMLVERVPLAIASCGNAALAAATLARAATWPIDVYVPTWMTAGFEARLIELGATIHRCERSPDDPPGDPAMGRFREAVEAGAIPFSVQGPENALCLDGGRTIGWEIARQAAHAVPGGLDRVFVQVGGGAFATSLSDGLDRTDHPVPLSAVQSAGCAPLARAWQRAADIADIADHDNDIADIGARWSEIMTVWNDPRSAADGILDDETYDWLGVVEAMRRNGGRPVVASEMSILDAHERSRAAGFDVSATGSAGLAGLIQVRDEVDDDDNVVVVTSGIAR